MVHTVAVAKTQMAAAAAPLLEPSHSGRGTASKVQTLGNILVSITGTGILGLPYAFRVAGWLTGLVGLSIAGLATYYCMVLLVECKNKIASERGDEEESTEPISYGDVGFRCMGKKGRYLAEFVICTTQCGGFVSYLVFIGQNLTSTFSAVVSLSSASYIFLLVPIEIALSWIGSLSALASFSIFADVCNVLAMGVVVKEDVVQAIEGQFSIWDRKAIAPNIGGLPFTAGMAVYCFEGIGMILPLEASMKDRSSFNRVLGQAFFGIGSVYFLFGFCGYMAFGDETQDIISLNLPHSWSSMAVQIGLCLALTFTLPFILRPISEIVEGKLRKITWLQKLCRDEDNYPTTRLGKFGVYTSRVVLVVGLATVASFVPGFGVFTSATGSTICALLSFVLPATFHLMLFGESLHFCQKALDICILSCGLLFAVYGTYNAVVGV